MIGDALRWAFWRLLPRPQVGDVYEWRDTDPWESDPTRLAVVEVRGNWARVQRSCGTMGGIYLRTLLSFYRKVTP